MYTRCPSCEAVFALSLEELAEAAGVVRCSNCGKSFNSLAQLFAVRPDAKSEPLRGQGMPPLLANRVLLQPSLPGLDNEAVSETSPASQADEIEPMLPTESASAGSSKSSSMLWPMLVGLLGVFALGQGFWLASDAAPGTERESGVTEQTHTSRAISLVGRDLHPHPSREDAVVINALLRNNSAGNVDFPLIELRLFDRSNQLLGVRRLQPNEYLPDPERALRGLGSGSSLPVIVEVAQTGSEPTGFELRFL